MLITPNEGNKYDSKSDFIFGMHDRMMNAIKNGDTKFEFAMAPIVSHFPINEGIHFIVEEILQLDIITTQAIANTLSKYIDFVRKYKIEIINKFDKECSLSLEGNLPMFPTDKMKIQSYFGFNHFQIVNSNSLSRTENGFYVETIDFTNALDTNVTSNFMKYHQNGDEQYRKLSDMILSKKFNLDIMPYVFELTMDGLRKYGINYKLNKNNKNQDQQKFFENLKILHKHKIFSEKSEKIFINNIIKDQNKLIESVGIMYYTAYIFVVVMMEAKFLFKDSTKKIKYYVFSELRRLNIPIENRYKAILYLFLETKAEHTFFYKIKTINNNEKYFRNLENVAKDIALSNLDKHIYFNKLNHGKGLFPFLASNDTGFIDMLSDTKPDFILRYNDTTSYVYKNIRQDIKKNYSNLFSMDSRIEQVEDVNLKGLMKIAKEKKENFRGLLSA